MEKSRNMCPPTLATLTVAAALMALPAMAAGTHSGGHGHDGAAAPAHGDHGHGNGMANHGKAGKAAEASRTVAVIMHDNSYEPESIAVKAGETIRFKVKNAGELVHEFNVGTAAMHAHHQKEMMMMVEQGVLMPDRIDRQAAAHMQKTMGHGMHHDPNSVLLEPGKSGEVIWTFPKDATVSLEFGCNVPGHYESGMHGQFRMDGGS
jgi:uncharacterized cupredoxin-like copper-binding protein